MAFIAQALDDAQESQPVPQGEYDLRILKAERKESAKGNMMTAVLIKVEDPEYPNASLINHFLVDVTKDTPPNQAYMRLLDLKRFLQAFGVVYEGNGYDDEDLPGSTGRMTVDQEENDGMVFNRLRLPKLKD